MAWKKFDPGCPCCACDGLACVTVRACDGSLVPDARVTVTQGAYYDSVGYCDTPAAYAYYYDSEGRCCVAIPDPSGTYTVTVDAAGYLSASTTFTLNTCTTVEIAVELFPDHATVQLTDSNGTHTLGWDSTYKVWWCCYSFATSVNTDPREPQPVTGWLAWVIAGPTASCKGAQLFYQSVPGMSPTSHTNGFVSGTCPATYADLVARANVATSGTWDRTSTGTLTPCAVTSGPFSCAWYFEGGFSFGTTYVGNPITVSN